MGDFVTINVSNSQNDVVSFEKKFPKDIKIAELKVIFLINYTYVQIAAISCESFNVF